MKNATIVTLTMNPALDVFVEVPKMEPDRKLRASTPIYRPGGGGINVSRAIRNLRGVSTAMFPSGGWPGELIAALLALESVPAVAIPIAENTRENVNVLDRATGSEYRIVVPGPELSIVEWHDCLHALHAMLPKPDYVVASGSLPRGVPVDFFERLAKIALADGFRLVIDTSGEPLRHVAAEGVYLLKPNLRELEASAGALENEQDIAAAAHALLDRGVKAVVVSAGARGATLTTREHTVHVPAPIVPVVSRIGAGDSMVAGVVIALAHGHDLADAVRYGVAAGTAAVTTPGHHLCTYEDTEKLFATMEDTALVTA